MSNILDVPQNFSTTLNTGGGINNSQTTGITLTSVTGLPTDGGILAFDWANPINISTIEYIEYGSLSGNDLAGVVRGQEGYTAVSHANGAKIVGVVSRAHIKRLKDNFTVEHDRSAGTHTNAALSSIVGAPSQGDIIYRGVSTWTRLSAGTSGQFLQTQGAGANPQWASLGLDGWTTSTDTLVYVSPNSFKIAGADRTTTYTKGTRIKVTNNSITYYGTVISSVFSTDTTVTLAPNADFSLANSAITNPFYSYASNPQGYPTWYNYNPTYAGFSVNPPNGYTIFSINGSRITIKFTKVANDGTSNSTSFTASAPVAAFGTDQNWIAPLHWRNNSSDASSLGEWYINAASSTITLRKTVGDDASWTATGGKFAAGELSYEF